MFDFVGKHKRLLQIFLAIVIVPTFALFGVQSYDRMFSGGNAVAEVDGEPITQEQFSRALEQQRDRMRNALGANFDASMFDTPEMRKQLLDSLISQRLLLNYAARKNIFVSNEQMREVIGSVPAFQEDGKFSRARYETLLRAQNMTPAMFEAQLRSDIAMQQLSSGVSETDFVAKTVARRLAEISGEQREISQHLVAQSDFAAQAKPTAEAVEAYYKSHTAEFQTPEQARAEYVTLSRDALAAQDAIPAEEVRRFYAANIAPKFKERAEARKKAEGILAELRKNPDKFAELAKQHSQDPGSAAQGGDLGYFARGSMVKPFEDAVFKLKEGEISPLVESEFGFHIIKLTGIKRAGKDGVKTEERSASHILLNAPADAKEFDAAKADIERELRQQQLAKKFPEAAETFSNIAYEQPDSLQPLADRFKLKIETSGWLSKTSGRPPLDNPRVLAALFSEDAIKNKRNTEAVEIAPGRIVVARIVEHKPASVRPLEDVRSEIVKLLTEREALKLAEQAGAEKLKALQAGQPAGITWPAAKAVSRENPAGVDQRALTAIFKADSAKLPTYVGVNLAPSGYAVYRISKVETPTKIDDARLRAGEAALARIAARDSLDALVAGLRKRGDVKIYEANLLKKAG